MQRSPNAWELLRALLILVICASFVCCASKETKQEIAEQENSKGLVSKPADDWGILPVMVGLGAALAVAPPVLLLLRLNPNVEGLRSPYQHFSAYGTAGIQDSEVAYFTHSEDLEFVDRHLYSEFRVESYNFPGPVQFQTLRVGYLFRPGPAIYSGITGGYRNSVGAGVQNAVELGLPFGLQLEAGNIRFEPYYLFSSAGITWQYRLQFELWIPSTPLMAGMNIEEKPMHQNGPYFLLGALLLGVRI